MGTVFKILHFTVKKANENLGTTVKFRILKEEKIAKEKNATEKKVKLKNANIGQIGIL